jgi:alkanesulfonate monooxygenase SsuD/methylene tetrahydromethanopterin reductase-like flavin-dependent oxidoreductase (luciferase family)
MRVGIGLPTTVPGADGRMLLAWASRADAGPFASLGVLDRLVYDSFDPLIALAGAAAVTQRLRLVTMVVAAPLRHTASLARSAASINALAGGRLVLGLGVGAREEDYRAAGVEHGSRGRRLAEQLDTLRVCWGEGAVGPELLVGGASDQTFARVARYADGYVHGGGPPRTFARSADRARAAWHDAGRPGRPHLWAQSYYALGDRAEVETGAEYLRRYYAFTGPFAERVAAGLLTTPQAIAQHLRGYAEAGCVELVLLPTVADLGQLERLAGVLARLDDLDDLDDLADAPTGRREDAP